MVELGVVEQRYDAMKEVLEERGTVTEVAERYGRQSLHNWLRHYRERGMAGLVDRSKRPRSCPHRMPARAELKVIELRRDHPRWGPRRLSYELARKGTDPVLSRSTIYRILLRSGLVEPRGEGGRRPTTSGASGPARWSSGNSTSWRPALIDGSAMKILTGLDDNSRFCVLARAPGPPPDRSPSGSWVAHKLMPMSWEMVPKSLRGLPGRLLSAE